MEGNRGRWRGHQGVRRRQTGERHSKLLLLQKLLLLIHKISRDINNSQACRETYTKELLLKLELLLQRSYHFRSSDRWRRNGKGTSHVKLLLLLLLLLRLQRQRHLLDARSVFHRCHELRREKLSGRSRSLVERLHRQCISRRNPSSEGWRLRDGGEG